MSDRRKVFGENKNELLMKEPLLLRREPMKNSNLLLIITISVFAFLYIISVIFGAVGVINFTKGYLSLNTFINLFNNYAYLIIIACGLSIVMISGGIDISVAAVANLVCMACAVTLKDNGFNVIGALVLSLGIGLAFGALQGFLVSYLKIQPFIVTLAGMFMARGLTRLISTVGVSSATNDAFMGLSQFRINLGAAELTFGFLVMVVVVAVIFAVLRWTRFGRNVYAVGGNSQNALTLGINVNRTKFYSFMVCGLLAGLAGFVYIVHRPGASPSGLQGHEMNAIAACIIGGVLLTGGVGNVLGSMFGVLILGTIYLMIPSLGLNTYWQGILVGIMLLIFIVLQSIILGYRNRKQQGNADDSIFKKIILRLRNRNV